MLRIEKIQTKSQYKIEDAFKTILKGSLIVLIGVISGRGLDFVFKVMLARHFGPREYGLLSMALAIMIITSNIAVLGFNQGIARFVPLLQAKKEYGKLKKMVKFGAMTTGMAGIFLALILFFTSPAISRLLSDDNYLVGLIRLVCLVIPFLVLLNFSLGILRGLKDMKAIVVSDEIVLWLTRILLLIVIIMLGVDIRGVPVVYFFSVLGVIILVWIFIQKNRIFLHLQNTNDNISGFRELFLFSLPLSLSTVTTMFRKRFDLVLIGLFLPASQVGFYNAALPIAALITIFLFAINRITLPIASELLGQDKEREMAIVYKTVARWTLIITLPVFFLIFLFPDIIIRLFFGHEYISASVALRIISIGFFVNAASGSFGEYLQSYGETKKVFWISFIGTLINILLMVIMIPKFGIEGAAMALTFSLICMCLLGMIFIYRYRVLSPFSKEYFRTLILGSLIFANMLWLYPTFFGSRNIMYLLPLFVLCSCVYLAALYFLHAFSEEDKRLFLVFKNRFLSKEAAGYEPSDE